MHGFFLKKTVSRILFPIPFCLEVLLAGLILLWFAKTGKAQKTGKILVSCGTLMLFLFSWGPFSSKLLRPIEHRYPAFSPDALPPNGSYVVLVLGQGMSTDEDLPVEQRVNETLVARLIEGTRVYRALTDTGRNARLVVSMAGLAPKEEKEAFLNAFEKVVGLAAGVCEPCFDALDTDDELKAVYDLAPDATVIIASSASHIPRAMMIAKRLGIAAIPAPTVPECQSGPFVMWSLAPKSRSLFRTERAIYEYMGMAWEWLKAR